MLMMNVLNKNGYFFDTDTLTLHMTKAYERKTLIYGSDECSMFLEIRRRFPEMTIEVHKRKPSSNKPLPYKMMKDYIAIMPDAAARLKEFERVQRMSLAYKSPYKYVENWFKTNYPHYEQYVEKDEKGNIKWKATDLMAKAKKQTELAKLKGRIASEGNDAKRGEEDTSEDLSMAS